jgi:hypothetical protein
MPRKHDAHRDELEGVAQRLRSERPQASPLELDRIKTTAMSRAQAGARRGGASARRFAITGLTVGLMAAGTGGVLASVGSDGTHGNAATAQYGSGCDTNNGNGNSTGSNNGNGNGNGNGKTSFASYLGQGDKGKGKGSKGSGGGNNGSNNNSSNNGNENGNGNGNENGNESNDGNNNFNCNENSFNETNITETNNSTNTNSTTNNITNTYYATTVTVSASPTTAAGSVQAATTGKKTSTSSRDIKIHIKIPAKSKLRKVTLKVNGKVVSVLKGKKASANIKLTNLPCSTGTAGTTVTITAVTSSGKVITQSHTYHLCS